MNYEHCKGFIYEIKEGDTLYLLSRRFSIPLVELMRANPYADVYQLKIGDTLCIPDFKGPSIGRPLCSSCKPSMGRPPMAGTDMPEEDKEPPVEDVKPPAGGCCKPMKPWSPDNMEGLRPWGMEYDGDEGFGMNGDANDGNNIIKYVVQENDTLGNLLSDFDMELNDFFDLNDLNQVCLKPGSVVLLKDKK